MAGFIAVRMLRAGRAGGFNPFGENDASDDEEDDLNDVEEASDLDSEDEKRFSTTAKVVTANHWEYDAAVAIDDATASGTIDPTESSTSNESGQKQQSSFGVFGDAWEMPCENLYEDDDAEVFCVRWSPDDQLLAVGCGDGVVRIFHGSDGRLAYDLERDGNPSRLPNTCLRW